MSLPEKGSISNPIGSTRLPFIWVGVGVGGRWESSAPRVLPGFFQGMENARRIVAAWPRCSSLFKGGGGRGTGDGGRGDYGDCRTAPPPPSPPTHTSFSYPVFSNWYLNSYWRTMRRASQECAIQLAQVPQFWDDSQASISRCVFSILPSSLFLNIAMSRSPFLRN